VRLSWTAPVSKMPQEPRKAPVSREQARLRRAARPQWLDSVTNPPTRMRRVVAGEKRAPLQEKELRSAAALHQALLPAPDLQLEKTGSRSGIVESVWTGASHVTYREVVLTSPRAKRRDRQEACTRD
jgi:hypothetical protein